MRRRPGLRVVSAVLLLKQFGEEDGWASYQPHPTRRCSGARCAVGTAGPGGGRCVPVPVRRRMNPSLPHPHRSPASRVNQADLPVYE